MKENSGVSAGRDITGGQFAVGISGGSVRQRMTAGTDPGPGLRELLDRLARLVDEHAGGLPEGDEARGDVEDVRAQATADKPDRRRLADTLNRLAERVSSVAALVTAVKRVAETLGVPLG